MAVAVGGSSVRGASHEARNIELEDAHRIEKYRDSFIISVADGHGSESCLYSRLGAEIACDTFVDTMKSYLDNYKGKMDFLATFLNRDGALKVAQQIDKDWKRRTLKNYVGKKKKILKEYHTEQEIYKFYGTTLIGLMVTQTFVFAIQIGDGDMMYVDEMGASQVIAADKILGVETHSLSRIDSWKNAVSAIYMRNIEDDKPYLYLLSSDGFLNSHKTQEDFNVTCIEYYNMIRAHGFNTILDNLESWLRETSRLGCGDDITLAMMYVS